MLNLFPPSNYFIFIMSFSHDLLQPNPPCEYILKKKRYVTTFIVLSIKQFLRLAVLDVSIRKLLCIVFISVE